jgi:hypothetical protein
MWRPVVALTNASNRWYINVAPTSTISSNAATTAAGTDLVRR